jgi:hypothetical protein
MPQTVPMDANLIGSGIDATDLLAKAIDRLRADKATWLKTKIRQTVNDGESRFTAEGCLQRGPNHCARLELTILHGDASSRLVVVSDGESLAQVCTLAGASPVAGVERLPALTEATPTIDSAVREENLRDKGCGGPRHLLVQLRQQMQNAKMQMGLLDERPVIQIKGEISPAAAPSQKRASIACAYVDARTLWPHRLEWWECDKTQTPRLSVCIEFLEPQINQGLSLDDCARVFSYHPDGNERMTPAP